MERITLKALKEIARDTPYAGRAFPRPGCERLVMTRREDITYIDLNGVKRVIECPVDYYLYNHGGTIKMRTYDNIVGTSFYNPGMRV